MAELTELITIKDYIRYAMSCFHEAGVFFGHGTDNAWDEALALILHTLHLPHDINPTLLEARLLLSEREKLDLLIHKRIEERLPVPYLTHEAWFAGLSFYVDERVLIPRSPIAELIENQFQPWIQADDVSQILDLCTGGGCIAIACSKAFPNAEIDGSDISEDALAVAKINILRHHAENEVQLYHSNLFEKIPQKKYDIIVSNPPYVDATDMKTLPKEYHHEPQSALAAGHDGLDFVSKIIHQAKNYLAPNGILVVEVGNSEIALSTKYPELPFTWLEFQRGGGGVFLLQANDYAWK